MYIIYTKDLCKWCNLAKSALSEIHEHYKEFKFGSDFKKGDLQEELAKFKIFTDKITLPQIFKDSNNNWLDPEEYVGTYEDLMERLKKERVI